MHSKSSLFMISALTCVMISAYLFGGSSTEGLNFRVGINLVCAVCGLLIVSMTPSHVVKRIPWLVTLSMLLILLVLIVQLVPLPAEWLNKFQPAADTVSRELEFNSMSREYRPLSLTPYNTIITIAETMPVFLTAVACALMSRKHIIYLLGVIVVLTTISIVWGYCQVIVPSAFDTYIWKVSSFGTPRGAYANINHQANSIVITFPLLVLFVLSLRKYLDVPLAVTKSIFYVCSFIFVVGVVGAGSVAGYILAAIIFPASLMYFTRSMPSNRAQSMISGLLLAGIILVSGLMVFSSPQLQNLAVTSFQYTPLSRQGIFEHAYGIAIENFVVGTGAGSFSSVYALYEPREFASSRFINHAHNEYLELIIEYGLFVVLIFTGILLSWFQNVLRMGSLTFVSTKLLMLSISGVLLHSLIDYPLRSQFILIIFISCIVICIRADMRFRI